MLAFKYKNVLIYQRAYCIYYMLMYVYSLRRIMCYLSSILRVIIMFGVFILIFFVHTCSGCYTHHVCVFVCVSFDVYRVMCGFPYERNKKFIYFTPNVITNIKF